MIEKMSDFFAARVKDYDKHMIDKVTGCKDGYIKMSELLPLTVKKVLDLGCGTGLELDEIFKTHFDLNVTCIDLTKEMLDVLNEKHSEKDITVINANYLEYDFGIEKYDAVISFQSLHHFSHTTKIGLYKKIYKSLQNKGIYIEGDYMVVDQKDEDFYMKENERIRKEQNIDIDEFYHYDTPCTIDNQIMMMGKAGFKNVRMVFREENTTIIVAEKI